MRLLAAIVVCSSLWGQIPAPESVLGHKPGDDFYLASYDESLAYFQKLAASTGKLKLVHAGQTSEGRDWYIAIISSPENLRNFEKYRDIAKRLALVRGLGDAEARALAHQGKAMVHIDGGLHATEVAGAQHTIQLAYDLVTGNTPEIKAILDNVILYLWFSMNPDGQNMVVKWYRDHVGTAYEVSNMPGLWQDYIGHDNNRDGYMNNMIESRVVTQYELEYFPQVFYDHHQTAPFPARIWIPPFGDPVSEEASPLMWQWVDKFGASIAAYLEEHQMPGVTHRGRFDDWYPGFIDHVNTFRNTISFLTETALYHYATPHFYTVEEFPRDQQDPHTELFHSSAWRGGWWRLRDATNMMEAASMAVLNTAAKYREEVEYTRYQAGKQTMERYSKAPPFAYVIPRKQRDLPTAATLVEKMLIDGIEVHQATQAFHANGETYPAGSWIILMDQPFAALVKELFEVQHYPESHSTEGTLRQLPYDVTGWTLPMQMGVDVLAVNEPVSVDARRALRKIDKLDPIRGRVEGSGPVFAFSHNSNAALRAVNDILGAGGTVSFGKTSGTIYATGHIAPILENNGIDAMSIRHAPASWPVKKPRLAIYEPWTGNIDQGWTRWILEQFHFPFVQARNAEIQAGHLRDRYDTIIFAEQQARQIMEGMQPGTVPSEYAGGLGETGGEALRDFVRRGGTLIALGNASLFAIEQFDLPVTNALAGLRPEQFFCSGSVLEAEIRAPNHPVAAGLPSDLSVMFERNVAFDIKPDFRGRILAAYPRDRNPLRSGYLLGPQYIEGKAAAINADYGAGHIILIGFRSQWRGQSHGTYKFLFNAIYYNASMREVAQEISPTERR